jgi:Protein of unknown function (DUF819)
VYFPATSILAAGRSDVVQTKETTDNSKSVGTMNKSSVQPDSNAQPTPASLSVPNLSIVIFLSCLLLWLGEQVAGPTAGLPVCTLLTVIFASRAPADWMQSTVQPVASVLGTFALFVFFATAGAPGLAVAESVRSSIVPLGLFLSVLYVGHGSILAVMYWLFGRGVNSKTSSTVALQEQSSLSLSSWRACLAVPRLLVASSAAIGGPATAATLAQTSGWESLLVPSLIVGNIGYAIATFLGSAYFSWHS